MEFANLASWFLEEEVELKRKASVYEPDTLDEAYYAGKAEAFSLLGDLITVYAGNSLENVDKETQRFVKEINNPEIRYDERLKR